MNDRLPEDFRFGVATAAYQIEGAVDVDGRGESIWDRFAHTPGNVVGGDTGDVACDHYHRWREDLDLMGSLGVETYRFSISWSRVLPTGAGVPNHAGLHFYRQLAEHLRELGIEPLATLYHWDLPQALQDAGGWAERETADRFADYARLMARELGDLVSSWITINEPAVVAFLGHAEGVKAPGMRDWPTAVAVSHHLLLGHGLAARAIHEERPDARVSIALNIAPVYPASEAQEDADAATRMDGYLNRWFLDPLLRGRYPEDMTDLYERRLGPFEALRDGDLELIATPLPFLGVNYYSPQRVRADGSREPLGASTVRTGAGTAMGWEVSPQGLHELLLRLRDEYGNPAVYITENGAAFEDPVASDGQVADPQRTAYLEDHLAAVRQAITDGVDVRRYCVWSLLDNFEWEHGYAPRFGIVAVDYVTQRRVPKQSALWYRDYIRRARDGADGAP